MPGNERGVMDEERRGYIKLHRKVDDSSPFNDENPLVFKIWTYCLIRANFRETHILYMGREVILQRGQFVFGRLKWSEKLKCSKSTLRNILKKFENWDIVQDITKDIVQDITKDMRFPTIYQIKNYEKYQGEDIEWDNKEDKRKDNEKVYDRSTTGPRQDTQNNISIKKPKNYPPTPQGESGIFKLSEAEKERFKELHPKLDIEKAYRFVENSNPKEIRDSTQYFAKRLATMVLDGSAPVKQEMYFMRLGDKVFKTSEEYDTWTKLR